MGDDECGSVRAHEAVPGEERLDERGDPDLARFQDRDAGRNAGRDQSADRGEDDFLAAIQDERGALALLRDDDEEVSAELLEAVEGLVVGDAGEDSGLRLFGPLGG